MTDDAPETGDAAAHQDAVLSELAELGLAVARGIEARFDRVETVAEMEALAGAFEKVARGVRLSVALQARMARERSEALRATRRLALADARPDAAARRELMRIFAGLDVDMLDSFGASGPLEDESLEDIEPDECELDGDGSDDIDPAADDAGRVGERLSFDREERLEEDAAFRRLLNGPVDRAVAQIRADIGLDRVRKPARRSAEDDGGAFAPWADDLGFDAADLDPDPGTEKPEDPG